MVPRLDGIRRAETLQYLSYHGSALPDRIRADLDRCEALLLQTARPRLVGPGHGGRGDPRCGGERGH